MAVAIAAACTPDEMATRLASAMPPPAGSSASSADLGAWRLVAHVAAGDVIVTATPTGSGRARYVAYPLKGLVNTRLVLEGRLGPGPAGSSLAGAIRVRQPSWDLIPRLGTIPLWFPLLWIGFGWTPAAALAGNLAAGLLSVERLRSQQHRAAAAAALVVEAVRLAAVQGDAVVSAVNAAAEADPAPLGDSPPPPYGFP
jgi:hypothetical protein